MTPSRAGGWKKDLAAGTAFFLIAFFFAFSWGWDFSDDSWLLQVANRLVSDDALYRQVYLHVTPLSVYLLALPTVIFGPEMLSLKIEIALVFAAIVVVACLINEQLGAQRRYSPAFILALFAFASPARMMLVSYYSQVATFFLLASFSAWLSWRADGDRRRLYLAGALLGACFAAKQNTGVFGVLALMVAEGARAFADRERAKSPITNLAAPAAAFVIVVAILLSPVILTGAFADMVFQGFTGRGPYLQYGSVSYAWPILSLREVAADPLSLNALRFINGAIPFLLPFALLPLFLFVRAYSDSKERGLLIAVVAFSAAALAIMFPRSDPHHMIFAMPMLILATAYCWRRLPQVYAAGGARTVRFAAIAVAAGVMASMTLGAIQRVKPSVGIISNIPHFRGLVIPRYLHEPLTHNNSALAAFPRDGKTLLLGAHASMYYVAGDMTNPTKYDYPTIISLKSSGNKEVMEMIRDGRVKHVCLTAGDEPTLEPVDLKRWIRASMVRLPAPDFCEHYARREDMGATR